MGHLHKGKGRGKCSKWSEKNSEDIFKDSFVKMRALASLEYALPGNTALLCRSMGKEQRTKENNTENMNYYGSPPCYNAQFYTFNLWISKTSLNLI